MSYRISIGLFGKGSTNHLHRKEVVEAFRKQGVEVDFIVRSDYISLLEKLDGCKYSSVSFVSPSGWRSYIIHFCRYVRSLYPSSDIGRRTFFELLQSDHKNIRSRYFHKIVQILARYQWTVRLIVRTEGFLFQFGIVDGIDPKSIDQLLLLGIGSVNSEFEGEMTWWARYHNIPVIHIVGNYDSLSSKGFCGVPINRLLVWGPNMHDDAVHMQGITQDRVTEIGSIRYNINMNNSIPGKAGFIKSIGLDPGKKIILFAGFVFEYHYFEMLEIYDQLLREGESCQLILRIYPNKILMNSIYLKPLLNYAKKFQNVYTSFADPHYGSGDRDREVLQIEEEELWDSLNCCDVVVNLYSTISLEACIFDKPALNMWYFPPSSKAFAQDPVYKDYSLLFHNRRLTSYGAIPTANNRRDLVSLIKNALAHPNELTSERHRIVKDECGSLDGKACERLVNICMMEYKKKKDGKFDEESKT